MGNGDLHRSRATRAPLLDRAAALLDDVLGSDRALPAADKQAIILAVAAAHDDPALGDLLLRARTAGLSDERLITLASAMYLSRGEAAANRLLQAATTGSGPTGEGTATDPERITREFMASFGHVPPQVSLLATHAPEALTAYHLLRTHTIGEEAADALLVELTLFAVNASDMNTEFATLHALGARRRGATDAQLVEAGVCAIPISGIASWRSAAQAIDATRSDAPGT